MVDDALISLRCLLAYGIWIDWGFDCDSSFFAPPPPPSLPSLERNRFVQPTGMKMGDLEEGSSLE